MPYFYLVIAVCMNASTSVFGKLFNRKNEEKKQSSVFYNLALTASAFLGWSVLYAAKPSFDVRVLSYAVLFALCYTVCSAGVINALKHGPAMLTSLLMGLSLLLTTLWGFFFWDDKVTVFVLLGLLLVVGSITLCLYTPKKDEKSVSKRWLFYVSLAFFGNAGCSIVQRTQQVHFDGQYGNLLMAVATGLSALWFLLSFIKGDKKDMPLMAKSIWAPVCAGVCNLVLNLLVMALATTFLSPSLIYPVIGVGGLSVVLVFSLFLFEEKMRWWQWFGVAVGAAAVALLSL